MMPRMLFARKGSSWDNGGTTKNGPRGAINTAEGLTHRFTDWE